MSNFIKIVRNYEHICRVGKQIIDHKDLVRRAAPSKLDEEFKKQEERIQEFLARLVPNSIFVVFLVNPLKHFHTTSIKF